MLKDPLSRRVFRSAVFFVLGLATVFITLGATASALGQALLQYKNEMMVAGGVLILLFGLHFLGVFKIGLLYREARFDAGRVAGGPLGAYAMGLAFGFGWTPCIGPILGAILTWAAQEDTVMQGVKLLAVYSLGLGVPFLVAALFINSFMAFMKRFRRHLGTVEKIMGLMLVAVGLAFVTGGFEQFSYFMIETFPGLAQIEGLVGTEGLEVSLFAAFAGGLLSFLSPCVLPLAPPYLAYLAGSTLDELTGPKAEAKTA
jgi:cytochrome c-type biogenesis protein